MAQTGDLVLADKVAEGGAKMIREYVRELRRQGRIKGKLFVLVKDGRKRIKLPYCDTA